MQSKNIPPFYSLKIREEELKNLIARDWFSPFDTAKIVGNIDFSVAVLDEGNMAPETQFLCWAEAKAGNNKDIYESLIQLILTIGKARTYDQYLPPHFLGAFDAEKIVFLPYSSVMNIFSQNDFNWNVTPSDHETKEFKQLQSIIRSSLENNSLFFSFARDSDELRHFIQCNFKDAAVGLTKIPVNKNNFTAIYAKWLIKVKPSIALNWDKAKIKGILDADFYLADLLSSDNISLKESLFVLLKTNHYKFDRNIDDSGIVEVKEAHFKDSQKAHTQFWNLYSRPPKEEFWQYILDRRDLLVPQDVRERKGSFYTPRQWVELSQKYLAEVLGEDWQTEYYIWDCCAGTGNLLVGLTEKYRIWASTLDKADVSVMKDMAKTNKNFVDSHIFQFDFLNDSFEKLPDELREIIHDPKKRKKLVVYINPPYAEASDMKTLDGREGKRAVEQSKVNKESAEILGQGNAELFAQFLVRIYKEIGHCIIGQFSTLKHLQGPHFIDFRRFFKAELKKMFLVPADSFDNVKGQFPIGFMVWDTSIKVAFHELIAEVYDRNGNFLLAKKVCSNDHEKYINDWIKPFRGTNNGAVIGKFPFKGNDFQNQRMIIIVHPNMVYNKEAGQFLITKDNLIKACLYLSVRKIPEATWLNDRDQFLAPLPSWESDSEFQTNCLCWALFNNNIQSEHGINHWIPFTEKEVEPQTGFKSHFMTEYMTGKIKQDTAKSLVSAKSSVPASPLVFSEEAKAVFEAGKALYRYYHEKPDSDPNAGLYDIKKYFQGINDKGRMNTSSSDEDYTVLLSALRTALKVLETRIEPKIYEHGFLKK